MRILTRDTRNTDHPHRQWHVWFAWHPVSIKRGEWRWLERVDRKIYYDRWNGRDYWTTEYLALHTYTKKLFVRSGG